MKESGGKSIQKLLDEQSHIVANRLFQEKSLDGVIELNKEIQQIIKLKNIELRKLFYSKYLELISCSQLISDLNGFANRIDGVADEINIKAIAYREQQVELKARQDVVGLIERMIRKEHYLQALLLCTQELLNNIVLSAKEIKLLRILEIDLVDKVLSRLQKHFKIDELEHHIKTIAVFAYFSARNYLSPGMNYQRQYGSNIGLLLNALQDKTPIALENSLIIASNTAFRIKTTSIQHISSKTDLTEYIKDIQNIIKMSQNNLVRLYNELSKACGINGQSKMLQMQLRNLESDCFKELHRSLAKSILSTDTKKKIAFNHSLYESILADKTLMDSFKELQHYFTCNTHIQDILLNLWNDFYQQMTEYSLSNIDVAISLQSVIAKGNGVSADYKIEIAKHTWDRAASFAFEQSRKYNIKLCGELDQLRNLFTKASPTQLPKMHHLLFQKYSHSLAKSPQRISQLFSNISNLNTRINVVIACELLLAAMTQQSDFLGEFDDEKKIKQTIGETVISSQKILSHQIGLYLQEMAGVKLEDQMRAIEDKLMEYVPLIKDNQEGKAFKELIIRILDIAEKDLKSRNLQKVKYTKRCLEGKQQQLSTYTCLFHYLPSHLFGQPTQHERFNIKGMEELLMDQKATKRIFTKREAKLAQDKKDFFESSTETGKDVLKFASKLSNSLVGLINRMAT